MNILKIKEIKEGLQEYRENFRLFRTLENNSYFSYTKDRERAKWEEEQEYCGSGSFEDTEVFQYFLFQWEGLFLDEVFEVYNHLGWEKDDTLENCILYNGRGYDDFIYYVEFTKLHDKIQSIEDDIEYAYAVCLLAKAAERSTKICDAYTKKILSGINECGLGMVWDWSRNRKAFVAMWFNEDMAQARIEIKNAIRSCGYEPMVIDEKAYNGQIVPEIYKEIEESVFVVADLSGGRGGVYYEAGYAMGKGKQLILTCRQEETDNIHFDMKQYNTIFWSDSTDLYNKLVKRIEAEQKLNHIDS